MRLRTTLLLAALIALATHAYAQTTGSGGRGGSSATVSMYSFPIDPMGGAGNVNMPNAQVRLTDFISPSASITASKITYVASTSDNTANLYDIGIYTYTGTLVCHIGATPGTTFSPSAGTFTLPLLSSCSLAANTHYLFGMTAQTGTAKLSGIGTYLVQNWSLSPTGPSSNALPASISVPADGSWIAAQAPAFELHN